MVSVSFAHLAMHSLLMVCTGPNAVNALRGLGVLDEVVAKADPPKLGMRPYTFISGKGDHYHIFDVRLNCPLVSIVLTAMESMLYQPTKKA